MTAPTAPLSEERRAEAQRIADRLDDWLEHEMAAMIRNLLVEVDRIAAENADLQRVLAETILHNADHSLAMLQMVGEAATQKRGRR